jgi:hypothetical protein
MVNPGMPKPRDYHLSQEELAMIEAVSKPTIMNFDKQNR